MMPWSTGSSKLSKRSLVIEQHQLVVSGIRVEVCRRDIMHLHVGVYPPHGRVRVAAPLRLTNEAVRLAVISRLGWIRRRRAAFQNQDRQSRREMVTGESHYLQGRRYRLSVIHGDGTATIAVRNNTRIDLRVPQESDVSLRDAVLARKYRQVLREQLPPLVAKWEQRTGLEVAEVRIRRMKTRWGSCNPTARRIWLNLELAKKSPSCVEYILVHEMVHFWERQHNERFRELMNEFMPTWQLIREELNRAPLAHEHWRY